MRPRQRTLIFGAIGDQHHRRRARNHGEEIGQHRLADGIDPVRILDDEHRRFGARQRHRIDECGQPAPPRIRVDLGQRHIRVPNADAQDLLLLDDLLGVADPRWAAWSISPANIRGVMRQLRAKGS